MEGLGSAHAFELSFPWAEVPPTGWEEMSDRDIKTKFSEWDNKVKNLKESENFEEISRAVSNRSLYSHFVLLKSLQKLERADEEITKLKLELDKVSEDSAQQRDRIEIVVDENDVLESANKELKEQINDLRDHYENIKVSHEELKQENNKLFERNSGIETEWNTRLERKDREFRELSVRYSKLELELDTLGRESSKSHEKDDHVMGSGFTVCKTSVDKQSKPAPLSASNSTDSNITRSEWISMFKINEKSILDKVSSMISSRDCKMDTQVSMPQASTASHVDSIMSPQRKRGEEWLKFCKNITRFNPETSKSSIDEFLAGVRSRMKTNYPPFSNEEKICILRVSIEGSAQISIEKYPEEVQGDFNKLCDRLLKDFGRFPCEDAALAALRGKEGNQMSTERPGEFVRRLERLCSQAYGQAFQGRRDIHLRVAFTEGLLPYIREKIEMLALTDLDEIVSKAEVFYHKGKSVKFKEPALQVFQVNEGKPAHLGLEFTPESPNESRQSSAGWQGKGQGRKETTFKGKCFECNRPGHRAWQCKSKGNYSANTSEQQSFQEFLNSMKSFFVKQVGSSSGAKEEHESK